MNERTIVTLMSVCIIVICLSALVNFILGILILLK